MPRAKVNNESNYPNSERKVKAPKQKHKSVNKGPSIENLVYTPLRNDFTNNLPLKEADLLQQESYINKSKSSNTRKTQSIQIQPIQHLTEDALDLDTELWKEQNRY